MSSTAPCVLLALTMVTGTCAQVVSPAAFARADGTTSDFRPLTTGAYRWQQIHDDLAGRAGTFTSLGLRLDDSLVLLGTPSYSVALNMWVSTAATGSAHPNATFDLNHGADRRQVRASTNLVDFPAVTGAVPNPRPFEHFIPFDQPFAFGGAGGLCWDVQVLSTSATRLVGYDSTYSNVSNPAPKLTALGSGCRASVFTSPFQLTLSASFSWSSRTGTLRHTGVLGPLTGTGFLVIGGQFAPTPLPGTGNGSSGTCSLYTNPLIWQPLPMPSGVVSFTLPLTLRPSLHGVTLIDQLVGLDPAANSLGVVTSNAYAVNVVAPVGTLPIARISSTNNAAGTGLTLPGEGLVVQLR